MVVVYLLLHGMALFLVNGQNTCQSQRGLKFDPAPSMKRSKRLDMCNEYRANTCCNSTHVEKLKKYVHETRAGRFNEACRDNTERVTCAACHPEMGTGEMEYICPTFCTEWYESCKHEHYSAASDGARLIPCYGNALICSPLSEIVSDGQAFCQRMSFEVTPPHDRRPEDGELCFDGGKTVPESTGMAEPTESLLEILERFVKAQQDNPSEGGLLAIALSFLILMLTKKLVSRGRKYAQTTTCRPEESPVSLSLEEIRQRQQDQYAALARVAGHDSSSSSESEEE